MWNTDIIIKVCLSPRWLLALLMSWTNITWSPTRIHCQWPTSHGHIIAHYSTQEASDYRFFKS